MIERGRRHPVLGPLIVVLLVLLIAFTLWHEGNEAVGADAGVLCVGIALVLMLAALIAPSPSLRLVTVVVGARAPPRHAGAAPVTAFLSSSYLPLRL